MPRFGLLLVAAAAAVCGPASLVQAQQAEVTPSAIVGGRPVSCERGCIDLADQWKDQIWRDNECDAYRPESALSSGCREFAEKQGSAYLTLCQDCCDTLYSWTHSCKPPQNTKYPPTVSDRVEVASSPAIFTQSTPCLDGCTRIADGASALCREWVKPRERRQCQALVAATHDQCQATCQSDRQVVKVNSVDAKENTLITPLRDVDPVTGDQCYSCQRNWHQCKNGCTSDVCKTSCDSFYKGCKIECRWAELGEVKSGYFTWPEGTCQFRCELENSDKSDSWINKCALSCPPCLPAVQELYTSCMFAAGLAPKNEVASEKAFCLNQLNERKALCH